jgi:hypothetical protein
MNTTRRGLLLGAASATLLAGCAAGGLVSGQVQNAGASVTLAREWSDITFLLPTPRPRDVKMLSIDGPLLNRLYLAAVRPGESLLRPSDRDTPRPTYQADMSDSELVEFVIDCVAQEYQNPEASALRPQNMGAAPGIRFDIATRTAEGLDISGTALVARHGERLHLLLFLAPTEHYYSALLPDVEAIFSSATIES